MSISCLSGRRRGAGGAVCEDAAMPACDARAPKSTTALGASKEPSLSTQELDHSAHPPMAGLHGLVKPLSVSLGRPSALHNTPTAIRPPTHPRPLHPQTGVNGPADAPPPS
jgi:hypothetical protein